MTVTSFVEDRSKKNWYIASTEGLFGTKIIIIIIIIISTYINKILFNSLYNYELNNINIKSIVPIFIYLIKKILYSYYYICIISAEININILYCTYNF